MKTILASLVTALLVAVFFLIFGTVTDSLANCGVISLMVFSVPFIIFQFIVFAGFYRVEVEINGRTRNIGQLISLIFLAFDFFFSWGIDYLLGGNKPNAIIIFFALGVYLAAFVLGKSVRLIIRRTK